MYRKIFKYKERLVFVHHRFVQGIDFSYIKDDGTLGRVNKIYDMSAIEFQRKFNPVNGIKYVVKIELPKKYVKKNNKAKFAYIEKSEQ